MKTKILLLIIAMACCISLASASDLLQPWCGTPAIYFSHAYSGDITGYEGLKIYPDGTNQVDENITVKNTLGWVLVDSYVSRSNLPDVSTLRAGLWRFRTFHYVSLSTGSTVFNFTVFKRNADGTESLIFSTTTDDINSLTATEYLTSYVTQTDTTMLPTDRLVIKVYSESTHSSNVISHFLYEGSTNTSHVVPPLMVCLPESASETGPGTDSIDGSIGIVGGLIAGLIGAVIIRGKQP